MPAVSYDSKSFSIDGRRVWLVSGSIHYATVPRGLWRARIRAAREAGLNCIEVPVVWALHENDPGSFDFENDRDLRAFIKTVGEEGMYCVLRPGPYIGSGYDFGGLPAYLQGLSDKKSNRARYREDEPLFLEAVDRYFRALMEQVRDLQVSAPGPSGSASFHYPPGSAAGGYQGEGGGPILLVQVEHAWECHDPEQLYLTRLVSMLRQHGCELPLTNANNLWQTTDGTLDTWRGGASLPAMSRQLAAVRPDAPPMISHFELTQSDTPLDYRLAALLGVGTQWNLSPFYTGPKPAALGDAYASNRSEQPEESTVLHEDGSRGEAYRALKRVGTFASQFGSLLAHRDTSPAPAVSLNEKDHAVSILHHQSSQGEAIVLAKSAKDKSKHTELLLTNGLTLDVPHAGQRAAWVLIDASLGGRTTLDYSSLSPWALMDRQLLVVFGPAGAEGVISIDGEHRSVTVPTGKTPTVIEGDPIHLAVLNHEQIDAAYRHEAGLFIGCDGFDDDGKPRVLKGWGTQFTISTDGEVTRKRVSPPTPPAAPRLKAWQALSLKSLVDGNDPSYEAIDGPAPLGELAGSVGYGWYRFNTSKATAGKTLPPHQAGRLHLYQNGKLSQLLGENEGAERDPVTLKLDGVSTVLADALGRCSAGQSVGQDPKGLADHLHYVKPIKAPKPVHDKQPAGDPFAVHGYVHHGRVQTAPISESVSWMLKPESRKPIIVDIHGLNQAAVVSVNSEPIAYYDPSCGGSLRCVLDPAESEAVTGGKNEIKLELLEPLADGVRLDRCVTFYQSTGAATPSDGWAFAPWSVPATDDDAWRPVPKSLPSQPSWLMCSFAVESLDTPLVLQLDGMSKGQVVLNGHDLGRYWHQTREGKIVDATPRCYLPEAWLKTDEPNVLMLFDEHGRTPSKCKLVYASG
jgi:hypothetical protein